MINFATNFKYLRTRAGMNQEEAAKLFNVDRRTISAWECGTRSPKTRDALRIAEKFNVDIDDLITGDLCNVGEKIVLSNTELDLVKSFRALTDEQKTAAVVLIRSMVK